VYHDAQAFETEGAAEIPPVSNRYSLRVSELSDIRQRLFGKAPAGQPLALGTGEQALRIRNRERIGVLDSLKFAPGHWRRDRRAGPGTHCVREDRGAATLVA